MPTDDDPDRGPGDDAPKATVSIVVRVRRTVTEALHISVPVTDDLIVDEPDGSSHLDGGRVFAAAIRLGQTAGLPWRPEGEPVIEIHPWQTPPDLAAVAVPAAPADQAADPAGAGPAASVTVE